MATDASDSTGEDSGDSQDSGEREGTLMGQKVNPYGFRLGVTTEWKRPLVRGSS